MGGDDRPDAGGEEIIVIGHPDPPRDLIDFILRSWGIGGKDVGGGEPIPKPEGVIKKKVEEHFDAAEATLAALTTPPASFGPASKALAQKIHDVLDALSWLGNLAVVGFLAILITDTPADSLATSSYNPQEVLEGLLRLPEIGRSRVDTLIELELVSGKLGHDEQKYWTDVHNSLNKLKR